MIIRPHSAVIRPQERINILRIQAKGRRRQSGKDKQEFSHNCNTLDLQRSSLQSGLYGKNSKFMPIKKV
jgi:hypothetical protein